MLHMYVIEEKNLVLPLRKISWTQPEGASTLEVSQLILCYQFAILALDTYVNTCLHRTWTSTKRALRNYLSMISMNRTDTRKTCFSHHMGTRPLFQNRCEKL